MSILARNASARNANPTPSANSRDSWPDWTEQRWTLAPERTNPLDSIEFLAEVARRPERCLTQEEFTAWRASQTEVNGPPMAWLPLSPTFSILANLTPVRFDTPRPVETEEYRPTFDDRYEPTAEDYADYEAWLTELDARDDVMREWAEADRAEAMEAAFGDPWDLLSDAEIAECGGFHPANGYDD